MMAAALPLLLLDFPQARRFRAAGGVLAVVRAFGVAAVAIVDGPLLKPTPGAAGGAAQRTPPLWPRLRAPPLCGETFFRTPAEPR